MPTISYLTFFRVWYIPGLAVEYNYQSHDVRFEYQDHMKEFEGNCTHPIMSENGYVDRVIISCYIYELFKNANQKSVHMVKRKQSVIATVFQDL